MKQLYVAGVDDFVDSCILTSDDSGHWYVIREADKAEFNRRIAAEEDIDDLIEIHVNGHPSKIRFFCPELI